MDKSSTGDLKIFFFFFNKENEGNEHINEHLKKNKKQKKIGKKEGNRKRNLFWSLQGRLKNCSIAFFGLCCFVINVSRWHLIEIWIEWI